MQPLLKTEPTDTQVNLRAILPVAEIPTSFEPLATNEHGTLNFLPNVGLLDDLHSDPAFADEPTELINRNGVSCQEFVDFPFLALWVYLYPGLKIPKGEEREKLRDYVRMAAYLKATQEGLELLPAR